MTFFSGEKEGEQPSENDDLLLLLFSGKRLALFKCISFLPSIKGESSHALIDSHLL